MPVWCCTVDSVSLLLCALNRPSAYLLVDRLNNCRTAAEIGRTMYVADISSVSEVQRRLAAVKHGTDRVEG